MKNKLPKILLSTSLCVAMVGSTCFAAGGTLTTRGAQTITGVTSVKDPVYSVTVPTDLAISVDPFEQLLSDHEVYTADLPIINQSNVPVKVTVKAKVTPDTGVTLVDSADAVSEADDSKNLFVGLEIPSAITETSAAAAAYPTAIGHTSGLSAEYNALYFPTGTPNSTVAKTYTGNGSDTEVSSVATEYKAHEKTVIDTAGTTKYATVPLKATDTELSFALAAAKHTEYISAATAQDTGTISSQFKEMADDGKGSTAFRFTGKVNTTANWTASDVTAVLVYDFIGLTTSNYTAATFVKTDDASADSWCLMQTMQSQTSDGTADATYTLSKTLKSLTLKKTGVADAVFTSSQYSATATALTIPAATISAVKSAAVYGTGTVQIVITYTDDTTETVNLVIS